LPPPRFRPFLLEAAFYVGAGVEDVRRRFERLGSPAVLAAWMTVSAVIPYCLYALFTGTFRGISLLELAVSRPSRPFGF